MVRRTCVFSLVYNIHAIFYNHNQIKEGPIFYPTNICMLHNIFANVTHVFIV